MKNPFRSVLPHGASSVPVFYDKMLEPSGEQLKATNFVAVFWCAVVLRRYRWDSQRRFAGLLVLFDSLKTPIVVSDIDGNIKFSNETFCELLSWSAEEMKITSYFSVFTQPDEHGKSIERYLKFFDIDPDRHSSTSVSVQNGTGQLPRSANCFTMPWDERKHLVTQLS